MQKNSLKERPLISFVILTCDRKDFVAAAIQSALNQSYQPLEVIVSDDHSEDGAFETVFAVASNYDGPHEVRLFRNEKRIGVTGNFNRGVALARGELVVLGSGDDISFPYRVEEIWKVWQSSRGVCQTFCSTYQPIDASGRPTNYLLQELYGEPQDGGSWFFAPPRPLRFLISHHPGVCGATLAFHREQFNRLGPLPITSGVEDLPMAFRAMLHGGLGIIRRPLVQYRRHASNMWTMGLLGRALRTERDKTHRKQLREVYRRTVIALAGSYSAMREDLRKAYEVGWVCRAERILLCAEARRQERIYTLRGRLQEKGWPVRTAYWLELALLGCPRWVLRDLSINLLPERLMMERWTKL